MTADTTFRVMEIDDDAFRWELRAGGDSVLATGGVYGSKRAAMRDIQRVKRSAPEAGVESTDAE